MEHVFGPGGQLARGLPSFEPRAEQAALAEAVLGALETGEHLLAEAGTGTGKTLAYLVPALDSCKRVVVATATKALQRQLVANDVPAAAAALGREVDCALLKGRDNYLCRRSLQGFELLGPEAAALLRSDEDAAQYAELRPWIETTETGDRAELDFEPSSSLWSELAVGGERCLGRRCAVRGSCFSEAARKRASGAELVITNHALYLADMALRFRAGASDVGVLPEHDAVILDEAHRLEEAAARWFGGRLSLAGLRRLCRDVERHARESGEESPARLLAEIDRLGQELIDRVAPERGRRRLRLADVEPVLGTGSALGSTLLALGERLSAGGDEADALARRAHAAEHDLWACLELEDGIVAWSEPGLIAFAPVDVGAVLREALWESGITAVLVSATLEAPFLRRRLGLGDARELELPSPFLFEEQALLYVPEGMPEPRAPGYAERLGDEVVELCRLSRGRALVLTSSFRTLAALAERAQAELPFPVLRQGEAPRERLLDRFRDEVDSVLVATQTFWQGVDIPGDSLSLLVIDKLPFAPPDDPLVQARCERIASEGGDWFSEEAVPRAILQLRQGFGRLIRSHEDRGVVAILDARLRNRLYGRRFLAALPPCPVVSDRAAVAAFFTGEPVLPA
jgi:ATP-dependent DNA helicase DinG